MSERWRPVPGYERFYEISDMGQFIILQTRRRRGGRAQEAGVFEGDKVCLLYNEPDDPIRRVFLSNLVLETFIGPRPPGLECCHLDDDRRNNRLDNLRWDTHSANKLDAVKNGIANHQRGEECRDAKLTEAIVKEARELYRQGIGSTTLARAYGVSESVMYKAVNYWTWKHVI